MDAPLQNGHLDRPSAIVQGALLFSGDSKLSEIIQIPTFFIRKSYHFRQFDPIQAPTFQLKTNWILRLLKYQPPKYFGGKSTIHRDRKSTIHRGCISTIQQWRKINHSS